MKRIAFPVAALLATVLANAQVYEWKDEKGKTHFSDKPPSGAAQARKLSDPVPAAASLPQQNSAADRELDYRKRQKDAQDKSEQDKKQQTAANEKKDACEAARRQLELLESGERIVQRDANGERSYLDDTQRQQEATKTRQLLQSSCAP